MAVVQHRRPDTRHRSALRAWTAVALIPVGLVCSLVVAVGGTGTTADTLGALLLSLVALAAPTAAVVLGVWATRSRAPSGGPALVVAAVLLLGMLVLLPVLVIGSWVGWALAIVVVVTVLGVFTVRPGTGQSPAAEDVAGGGGDASRSTVPVPRAPDLHVLPRSGLGWWALGLLLVAAAFPVYWGPLEDALPHDISFVLIPLYGLAALGLAGAAIFRRNDRSVLLTVLAGLTLLLAMMGVLVGIGFALGEGG